MLGVLLTRGSSDTWQCTSEKEKTKAKDATPLYVCPNLPAKSWLLLASI